ncbi:MAG: hypothetical protein JWQ66_3737 [Mucilaginibacter sp.]|nr:hypothetical protein [Mucilaginibacter sp.]
MSEHNYNYHDDNFSLDKAEAYTLLIQIDKALFSYAIADENKLIAWAENHPLDELSDPQELLDLLSAKYKQVVIGLPATGFTLLPQSVFNPDRVSDLARFLDVKSDEKVLSQDLDADNVIIYKTHASVLNAAEEFGLRNTVFSSKGWVNAIAQNNPGEGDLYLNITGNNVEILNFKAGKLRFYNTFEFNNDDELTYFAAFAAEELFLFPSHTSIYLSGDINADDKSVNRLAEFFIKVELNNITALQLPEEIVAHRILSIAALSLCVSSEVV